MDITGFNKKINKRVKDIVESEGCEVVEVLNKDTEERILNHLNFRMKLFTRYLDQLNTREDANIKIVDPPIDAEKSYHLVYQERVGEKQTTETFMCTQMDNMDRVVELSP